MRPSNDVVIYVRAVPNAADWRSSVQVHAIEIGGRLVPGVILNPVTVGPFAHDEPLDLTVTFSCGQLRTADIRSAVVTRQDGEIVRIHHGWRALLIRAARWLSTTWKEHHA